MSADHQPEGYPTVTAFMIVEGADDLIAFLETTFDTTKKEYITGADGSVKHAEMRIGDSLVMIADARPPETKANTTMLYVYVPDIDATYAEWTPEPHPSANPTTACPALREALRRSFVRRIGLLRQPVVDGHTRGGCLAGGS